MGGSVSRNPGGPGAGGPWERCESLWEGFRGLANSHGYLKADEAGLRSLSKHLAMPVREAKKIDADKNGYIGFAEFALWADRHTVGRDLGLPGLVDKRAWRSSLPHGWRAIQVGDRVRLGGGREGIAVLCASDSAWRVHLPSEDGQVEEVEVRTCELTVLRPSWEVFLGGQWCAMDDTAQEILEGAHKHGDGLVSHEVNGRRYEYNLSMMCQTNPETGRQRQVRRLGGGDRAHGAAAAPAAPAASNAMPSQPSRRGLAPPARVAELLDLAKAERWPEVLATLDELPPQAVNALPRPRRWAVIHHAAAFAPLRVLKELVRRKADWEKSTADGMSPLQVALDSPCEDRLPVVKHLLVLRGTRKGVDLEQEAHRLLDDAREGQWEAVYARLDACPELVNVLPDPRKYTVFHQAAFHGALEVLRHLVERYQANPQAPSRDGKTALQIAVEQRHGPAIEYLGALAPALVLQDCLVDFPPQQFVEIEDPGTLRELQGFLDRSRKLRDNWTRDRGYACKGSRQHKPVPSDFRLVGAVRNENVALWRMYSVHREVLKLECQRYTEGVEPFTPWVPWTHEGDAEHCPEEPGANLEAFQLSTAANEWLLFHGSSSSALESIAKEGFNMNKVGQGAVKDWGPQALPLYGFGAYCCESITKGDEYARTRAASGRFEGCRGIGLVRVLGGRYLHTCDDSLPKRTLHEKVLHGPHHSTLGDRLALRGTFREYVTYDASSLYLEYILYYKRAYAPEDLPAVSEEDLDS